MANKINPGKFFTAAISLRAMADNAYMELLNIHRDENHQYVLDHKTLYELSREIARFDKEMHRFARDFIDFAVASPLAFPMDAVKEV